MNFLALPAIIGGFIKQYWKIIAIVVILFFAYKWHQSAVINYGNTRFQEGVDTTLTKVKAQVAEINKKHRAKEEKLQGDLDKYAENVDKADKKRKSKEDKIADRVNVMLQSVPMWNSEECSITPSILEERNAIRELGPS